MVTGGRCSKKWREKGNFEAVDGPVNSHLSLASRECCNVNEASKRVESEPEAEMREHSTTHRRLYKIRFLALPLGVFFFSWGST